jgi:hypothetical protein
VRQSIYGRQVSYKELNDAERLSQAPTFASSARGRSGSVAAALTSRSQSFETALLTQEDNLAGLAGLNRELITKGETIDSSHGCAGHVRHRGSSLRPAGGADIGGRNEQKGEKCDD